MPYWVLRPSKNSREMLLRYDKCSKISDTFLLSNKLLVFRLVFPKILVRIANREDPYQTASSSEGKGDH